MRRLRMGSACGWLAAVVGAAAAGDPALPPYVADRAIAGEVSCTRAPSMDTLMSAWAREFMLRQPEIRVHLRTDSRFPTDGFPFLLDGTAQVLACPRELFPSEVARFHNRWGQEPLLVAVATGSRDTPGGTHAIAIYVHADNPLARLSLSELREVFSAGGGIRTWGQLGLNDAWSSRPIRLHGMLRRRETGNPPGIVNYLEQRLLGGVRFNDSVCEHQDQPGVPALDAIVRAVADDPCALGYSGFANAVPGTKTIALAESGAGPYFPGTEEEVARREHPLTRAIYLCLGRVPDRPIDPAAREFLRYVLSRDGQRVVAEDAARFLPLPATFAGLERGRLE